MKIAPLADVKARLTKLSAYVDECGNHGPIIITRNGKPAALLIVPESDEDLERLILAHSPRFQTLVERSWRKIKQGKGLSSEAFWQAVSKRAERREKKAAHRRGKPSERQ